MSFVILIIKAIFVIVLAILLIWGMIYGGLALYSIILMTIQNVWEMASSQTDDFREFVAKKRLERNEWKEAKREARELLRKK